MNEQKEKAKELIEISIPNSVFFPDWEGQRLVRSAKVGENYKLTFGLPVPSVEKLGEFYPGLDITAAVRQHSYAPDEKLRKSIEEANLDYAKLVPEENDTVKAAFSAYATALTSVRERAASAEAKKVKAEKVSAFDKMAVDLGIDPKLPNVQELVFKAIAAIRAQSEANGVKKPKK